MYRKTFELHSRTRDEMIDIAALVQQAIDESGVATGMAHVYVPHTTAGVTINENADPDVTHDVLRALDVAVPWRQDFYRHGEGNSAAHLKSSLVGCSASVPVAQGRMAMGVWQTVYFCEFDGPRTRQCVVTVWGQ